MTKKKKRPLMIQWRFENALVADWQILISFYRMNNIQKTTLNWRNGKLHYLYPLFLLLDFIEDSNLRLICPFNPVSTCHFLAFPTGPSGFMISCVFNIFRLCVLFLTMVRWHPKCYRSIDLFDFVIVVGGWIAIVLWPYWKRPSIWIVAEKRTQIWW